MQQLSAIYTHARASREKGGLTKTPKKVLNTKSDKKLPANFRATKVFMSDRSNFESALKRTTDVASLTTPSPNTRLYNNGVSS